MQERLVARGRGTVAALMLSMLAAACGGGSGGQAVATTSPEQAKTAITTAWTEFFSATTSLDQEVAVLQNGDRHRAEIEALHKQMPARLSVRVISVVVSGGQATVTYDLLDNQTPLLSQHSTGKAVLAGGRWVVSESTFCSLVTLAGSHC